MEQKTPEGKAKIKEWSNMYQLIKQEGITWNKFQFVISGGNNLKRGVIHFYHDTPSAGHSGIANTYHMARQDY